MITGAQASITVAPPAVARGGVLAVANVQDVSGHELLGAEYETMACAQAQTWLEFCTTPGTWVGCTYTPPENTKVFDEAPEWVQSFDPFAVYAGVTCDFQRLDDAQRRAEQALAYGERRQVDAHVIEAINATAVNADTDIAPTGTTLAAAIGILEEYALRAYGGVATLLIPARYAPYAVRDSLVQVSSLDGTATTVMGTKVAFVLDPPDPFGIDRIWITGQITLLRGPVESYTSAPTICDDNVVAPPRALAERIYVPLIECLSAYVPIRVEWLECPCGAGTAPASAPPTTPPELNYLSHPTMSVTGAPFALRAHGENFTDDADITVNGVAYPTAFINDHEIVTVINPSAWTAGDAPVIRVVTPLGTSAPLTLTFTA